MSVQGDPGQRDWSSSGGPPWGRPDPWTSELWARPDTVGGYAPSWDRQLPPPPQPPVGPPPPSRRGLAVVAAVLAAVLLAGGVALVGALRSTDDPAVAAPRPSASALPSTPPTIRPTFPSPTAPPSTAPSAPPGVVPGAPPSAAPQTGSLTPQQAAAAAAVSKGLVDVNTTIGYDGAQGAGTGIVLSADGLVLTNHHVVGGATAIRVTDIGNQKTYDATVLGYDKTHDVAVLRLKGASGLTVAPLGASSAVKVGDEVVAVGNAGGAGGTPSAVAGTVRALDQQITVQDERDGSPQRLTGLIQLDAAIVPGDSGGAVVDAGGKVVGVITAASTGAGSGDSGAPVEGYAVPIDQARSIARQIIDGRSSSTVHIGGTGFLGVQVVPGNPPGSAAAGAQVASVVPGSAAERAGIRGGDVVTAVDGHAVASADALHAAVSPHQPGDSVKVAWTDAAGKHHSTTLHLGSGPVG
jgi:S1-C subfamily serine protease